MNINIGHLYPDLLNLYGDRGNVICIKKRCEWRGIDVNIKRFNLEDEINFAELDFLFLGGGSDRDQYLVCKKLIEKKDEIKNYVENSGVLLAICGGYQLLGHYYMMKIETIEGLSILDIRTNYEDEKRLIGDIVIENKELGTKIAGFENHSGRTYINGHTPLGQVIKGFGNNQTAENEGVIYKNTIGTYLHGPLLPKNPILADNIISRILKKKYSDFTVLTPLDDTLELKANKFICER